MAPGDGRRGRGGTASAGRTEGANRIRVWGVGLAVMILAKRLLGIPSAGSPGSQGSSLFPAHVGLGVGVVVVAVAGAVYAMARRFGGLVQAFALTTWMATVSAAVTGSVFFVSGFPHGALIDRMFALCAPGGAVALALHGTLYGRVREAA
jgi:hypothetical protein